MVRLPRRLLRLLRRVGLGRRRGSRKTLKPRAVAVVVDGDRVLVMKRHKGGRDYAVLPGGGVEEGETAAQAALRELHEETTLVAEIDRLLWTGRHNDRPASYFLMAAVRGRAELSGPEALANRPDNSFELRWITVDRFAELGLHPPDIRRPLAALLTDRPDDVVAERGSPSWTKRPVGNGIAAHARRGVRRSPRHGPGDRDEAADRKLGNQRSVVGPGR